MTVFKPLLLGASALMFTLPSQAYAQSQDAPPSEVQKIYDSAVAPSPERIRSDVQTLVDVGTRHTLSEWERDTRGIGAAGRLIFDAV